MKLKEFLLLICLVVIILTAILCIALYFERVQVWSREDNDDPRYARH